MQRWARRIRAAVGIGLTWGFVWSLAGGVLARLSTVNPDLPFPLLFAPLGFAVGVIFSGILAAVGGRRGFERMSLWGFAALGASSGLLLAGTFAIAAALRGDSFWSEFLLFGPALATAGAVCAAGSLAVARRGASYQSANPS